MGGGAGGGEIFLDSTAVLHQPMCEIASLSPISDLYFHLICSSGPSSCGVGVVRGACAAAREGREEREEGGGVHSCAGDRINEV